MSDDWIDFVLSQADESTLTLAQWFRVAAAAGATWQLEPDAARCFARYIDDLEQATEAARAQAAALDDACAMMRKDLVFLRSFCFALGALNVITWWLS